MNASTSAPDSRPISAAVVSVRETSRPTIETAAPRLAISWAAARPIPEVAPVMTT